MFFYNAYGLSIKSAIALPAVVGKAQKNDVEIEFGEIKPPFTDVESAPVKFLVEEGESYLFWNGVGQIHVRDGRRITIDPDPNAEQDLLRVHICGAAMSALLHQRGYLVLHASAVLLEGLGAIVFMGRKGWGKSTTAGCLSALGHTVLCDDFAAVKLGESQAEITQGFSEIRLFPDVASSLGQPLDLLPRLHSRTEKLSVEIGSNWLGNPIPLKRIYVLSEQSHKRNTITALTAQDALQELIRHSYWSNFLTSLDMSRHFKLCAGVINAVPVRRMSVKKSLDSLRQLAELAEKDARSD